MLFLHFTLVNFCLFVLWQKRKKKWKYLEFYVFSSGNNALTFVCWERRKSLKNVWIAWSVKWSELAQWHSCTSFCCVVCLPLLNQSCRRHATFSLFLCSELLSTHNCSPVEGHEQLTSRREQHYKTFMNAHSSSMYFFSSYFFNLLPIFSILSFFQQAWMLPKWQLKILLPGTMFCHLKSSLITVQMKFPLFFYKAFLLFSSQVCFFFFHSSFSFHSFLFPSPPIDHDCFVKF